VSGRGQGQSQGQGHQGQGLCGGFWVDAYLALPQVVDIVADPLEAVEVSPNEWSLLDPINPLADQVLSAPLLRKVSLAMRHAVLEAASVCPLIPEFRAIYLRQIHFGYRQIQFCLYSKNQ